MQLKEEEKHHNGTKEKGKEAGGSDPMRRDSRRKILCTDPGCVQIQLVGSVLLSVHTMCSSMGLLHRHVRWHQPVPRLLDGHTMDRLQNHQDNDTKPDPIPLLLLLILPSYITDGVLLLALAFDGKILSYSVRAHFLHYVR